MRSSERGVVLAMVLVVGFLVSIAMTAALTLTGNRLDRIATQHRHSTNFYAAEAGVQAAFIKLKQQITPFDNQPSWPVNGTRTDTLTVGAGPRARQVTVVVTRVNPSGGARPEFKISATAVTPTL